MKLCLLAIDNFQKIRMSIYNGISFLLVSEIFPETTPEAMRSDVKCSNKVFVGNEERKGLLSKYTNVGKI